MADHGLFIPCSAVYSGHRQVARHQWVMAGAARLAQQQGGLRVDVDEDDLHRGHIGLVAGGHLANAVKQHLQAPGRSPRASCVVRMVPLAT